MNSRQSIEIKEGECQLETVTLRYRYAGEGPLVICLHGFPDSAKTFDLLLCDLAAAGYRAVAPYTRGYFPSTVARDDDYRVPTLAWDVLGLMDHLGEARCDLVGHDWGAVTGYALANLAPERVSALVTAAVPHPRVLRPIPAQLKKSWYMAFFQLRWLADRWVERNDYQFIEWLYRRWSPDWNFDRLDLAPVKMALQQPANLRAALGYYRAIPKALLRNDRRHAIALVFAKTRVPSLVIYGENDGCMGAGLFRQEAKAHTAEVCVTGIAGAGHFMHREKPEEFNARVLQFLKQSGGTGGAGRRKKESEK